MTTMVPGREDVEYDTRGREVRSRTNYILGTDLRIFGNVSVRDPRHN